jgi:peptidoglycan hydrolase-like protein with peptidoglycan-binding domain
MKFATGTIATFGLIAGLALAPGLASATPPSIQPATPALGSTTGNPAATQPTNPPPMASAQNESSKLPEKTVMALQEALRGDGQHVANDGVWGPRTAAALKTYQQQAGLPVTGILDQATRASLHLQS